MKFMSFFKEVKKQTGNTSNHVKDFSVFDFNYIPDEPLMREEGKHLIKEMLRFEMSGIPTHQAVIGSKGSGKTLTLKYLQNLMNAETGLNVVYANCREHNTSFKIFAHLLDVQARGASLSELYERFCTKYQGKTIVLLDEIDLMSAKDKRKDILYFLSRSENPYLVIMMSNNHHVLKEIDAATKSSLQPTTVYFKNYDAQHIQEILHQRAKQGLYKWDKGKLAQIAAMTARKTNSDARVAIKTLFHNVTEPKADIETCFENARKDIIVDMINDLSDSTLMILQAVTVSRSDFARDIYKQYCQVSMAQNERPFSYMYFNSNLSYLQSMGLVALISTKVGRTFAHRVVLTFDKLILGPIYKLRFGRL